MLEYYTSHPFITALLILGVILAVAVLVLAIRSSEKRAAENRRIAERLKKDNEIKNKYALLTVETISSSPEEELFKGIGLNLQKRVALKADMLAEFDTLTKQQQYIYCLYTMFEDSRESLSNFFKINSKPLTDTALEGVKLLGISEFSEVFEFEYNAYDPDNEEVSCIPSEIEAADKKAAPYLSDGTVENKCSEFIKSNSEKFI